MQEGKYDLNHIFTITDTETGRTMTSVGFYDGGSNSPDGKSVTAYYRFKTADNESGVREIKYDNGKYKIEAMLRNRPIPRSYQVTGYKSEEKYTEEEKELMSIRYDIHRRLKNRCDEYLHYSTPRVLKLKSIGKTVIAEYFTADWFGTDDIINYKTDHVRMSMLSKEDLMTVMNELL